MIQSLMNAISTSFASVHVLNRPNLKGAQLGSVTL